MEVQDNLIQDLKRNLKHESEINVDL